MIDLPGYSFWLSRMPEVLAVTVVSAIAGVAVLITWSLVVSGRKP